MDFGTSLSPDLPRSPLWPILTRTEHDFHHLGDLGRCKVKSPLGSGMGQGCRCRVQRHYLLAMVEINVCLLSPLFIPFSSCSPWHYKTLFDRCTYQNDVLHFLNIVWGDMIWKCKELNLTFATSLFVFDFCNSSASLSLIIQPRADVSYILGPVWRTSSIVLITITKFEGEPRRHLDQFR